MGSEALLQQACELAFAVAREDAESDPSIEPPGDMRSFLYLSRLPRRAIAVAQQAIEDDSNFRSRVAARADETDVGRAGYLWLHRPIGWAPEFEELSNGAEPDGPPSGSVGELVDVPIDDENFDVANAGGGSSDEDLEILSPDYPNSDDEHAIVELASFDAPVDHDGLDNNDGAELAQVASGQTNLDPEADAIESELTSLRGLVDRLAGERELVMSGSPNEPGESQDVSLLEDELTTVSTELDFAREELDRVNQELTAVRHEREDAQRQQSDALRRQVDVERELALAREERAEIETRASDLQVNLISVEDRLKRLEGDLEEVERERNVSQSQLETMTTERNQVREDRMAIKAERDSLHTRLAEVDEKTGGVDVGELTSANRSLTQELEATSRELARMIAQVESYEDQLRTTTSSADSLKSEKVELSSRLADAELSLETTTTQYSALKDDAERLASDVGSLRAERDGLQSQLTELQASLADVLDEHAEIRHRNDADRKALNELRVERDVLLARMSDIEQADRSHENRVNALTKERDDLATARDDLIAERGELRGEVAAAASARDQLLEKIDALETKLGPLEVELQAERRQREELANRLLELDDIAAQNQAALEELTGERDGLSQERVGMTEKLQLLEAERVDIKKLSAERDDLQVRLERTESQRDDEANRRLTSVSELSDQMAQLESAKNNLENQISETQSELTQVRSDVDELNRENAKLRFNLQVAESTATEASDAAEEARKSAAQAAARAAASDARADRAEAEVLSAAPLMGIEGLVSTPKAPDSETEVEPFVVDGDAESTDESAPTADTAEPEEIADVNEVAAEAPVEDAAAAAGDDAIEVDGTSGTVSDVATDTDAGVDATDGVDEPAKVEPTADDEVRDKVDAIAAEVDTDGPDSIPSLLDPVNGIMADVASSGEHEAVAEGDLSDQVPTVLDEQPAADPTTTIPGFAPASDVVDMDRHRAADNTSPFNNDWKPVGEGGGEPDELDEISDLISATVSGFDSPADELAPTPPALTENSSFIDDVSAPPSVFGMGDGDLGNPPSAFNDAFGDVPSDIEGSNRRQIEIPPDIAGDEIAVALHVVSSPDVVLLVDGDSVANLGWPSLPVAQQRDALVTYLADLSASSGAAPDVVFDGRIGDDDSLPVSRAVRIRLSTPPTEPAAALDELVSAYPDQWPIALVTDDPSLAGSARDRGAVVLNNGQLLDLFIAQ